MKILMPMFAASILIFNTVQVQANEQQCYPDKILSSSTNTGILKDYFIEEVQDIPSEVIFNIQGGELRLVAYPEDIEKFFKKKEGEKFNITYERVYGWLGDGCTEYKRLVRAEQEK